LLSAWHWLQLSDLSVKPTANANFMELLELKEKKEAIKEKVNQLGRYL